MNTLHTANILETFQKTGLISSTQAHALSAQVSHNPKTFLQQLNAFSTNNAFCIKVLSFLSASAVHNLQNECNALPHFAQTQTLHRIKNAIQYIDDKYSDQGTFEYYQQLITFNDKPSTHIIANLIGNITNNPKICCLFISQYLVDDHHADNKKLDLILSHMQRGDIATLSTNLSLFSATLDTPVIEILKTRLNSIMEGHAKPSAKPFTTDDSWQLYEDIGRIKAEMMTDPSKKTLDLAIHNLALMQQLTSEHAARVMYFYSEAIGISDKNLPPFEASIAKHRDEFVAAWNAAHNLSPER